MTNANDLTRDEAIALVGIADVEAVDKTTCEFTGRLMDRIKPGSVEFSASVKLPERDDYYILEAIYYQDEDTLYAEGCELDTVTWTVDHYELR